MRFTGVELQLSRSLREEANDKSLVLDAYRPDLQRWARAMGTKLHWRPRVLFMRPNDPISRNLAIFLSEERTLPVTIAVLEQKVVTHGIADALNTKAEAERLDTYQWAGRLAAAGWAGGPILGLAGCTVGNVITAAVGGAGALAGGVLEAYLYKHPFEPHPLSDLPDLKPAVTVSPRVQLPTATS